MKKILITAVVLIAAAILQMTAYGEPLPQSDENIYLEAVITTEEAVEQLKSTIFDASQSFIPEANENLTYQWNFGDGNSNEGVEVLHAYREPGEYTVTLTISDGVHTSVASETIFVYRKLVMLIVDHPDVKDRIQSIQEYAAKQGVFAKVIESFGSSTEFISEEILNKKLTEHSDILQKTGHIIIWTKGNAGLNALSRYIQNNKVQFSQKHITIIENNLSANISRVQKQFGIIKPRMIILVKEAALLQTISTKTDDQFLKKLDEGGYEYEIINTATGKVRPWNLMSYFVNFLINEGIPDNTIALLLLLPVIATVVAFAKQVIGITTFGIYTPSIITLSFLIIGLSAGLLTLVMVISISALTRPLLKKIRMLYIPKMAIVITLVSLVLLFVVMLASYLGLFNAQFLSIAIFPMLILSTLVEKFVSVKSEKGFSSTALLMLSTIAVAIFAYLIAGGEINLGVGTFQFVAIKRLMINHPEVILVFLLVNILLGKWTGLRVVERIRFREVLRHIEE